MKNILVLFLLSAVTFAHMALYHPSCYGCDRLDQIAALPLADLPFSQWWFHAGLDLPPAPGTPPLALPAGGTFNVEIACAHNQTSLSPIGPQKDGLACDFDTQAMHTAKSNETLQIFYPPFLRGCGVAIAYKSKAREVKPEDFTVFTVKHDCVRQLNNEFEVPAGMPECPDGKCICAWFWQGQSSAEEMYMTGFDCAVTGGSKTAHLATPKPPTYCQDNPSACTKGAKQPMYWANDMQNVVFDTGRRLPSYDKRPSYNEAWGFKDGAQSDIFAEGFEAPPPESDPPVEEPPVEDAPVEDSPVEDPPAQDPPAQDPPAQDPPAQDPPSASPNPTPTISPTPLPTLPLTSPKPTRKGRCRTRPAPIQAPIKYKAPAPGPAPAAPSLITSVCSKPGECVVGEACEVHEHCIGTFACLGGQCVEKEVFDAAEAKVVRRGRWDRRV